MKATPLTIPDVVLIEPLVFGDERGFFFESFNQARFETAVGRPVRFVQDNHSRSVKHVLRGLHYQIQQPQGNSDTAEFLYKTTDYYAPAHERCILWNDSTLRIDWPQGIEPILSTKDAQGKAFAESGVFV